MSLTKDQLEALKETYRRQSASENLLDFTQYTFPGFKVGPHHPIIAEHLEKVATGEIRRLMVMMPPRYSKSEMCSRRFPAFYLGLNPDNFIISASYGQELASDFGRDVRGIVSSKEYRNIFPETRVDPAVSAMDHWRIHEHRGRYVAAGVGTSIYGRGAHLFLIDDPIKDWEEAKSPLAREKVWQWYKTNAFNRLQPKAAIILIMCMTGDTPVRMADGTEKPLSKIRPGDYVSSYDETMGTMTTSKVLNWINQGPDQVFKITTASGVSVKANARHPFLVEKNGKRSWVKTKDLRPGDAILTVTGKAKPAQNVTSQSPVRDSVLNTTAEASNIHHKILPPTESVECATDTGLNQRTMTDFMPPRKASVLSARIHLQVTIPEPIGEENSASTTVMTPEKSEDCSATTATSRSDMENPPTSCLEPQIISEIIPSGIEDVFDIQVENTENFIANGLISHNTRWHDDDLAGRLIDAAEQDDRIVPWTILRLPVRAEENDPLGRELGGVLWPEWYDEDDVAEQEAVAGERTFMAQYQQTPVKETGDAFHVDWFNTYDKLPPQHELRYYGASDYATDDNSRDYTVHGVFAVDPDANIYIVDWWRKKANSLEWVNAMVDLVEKWKPTKWFEEKGQILNMADPLISKRMKELGSYCRREAFHMAHDKQARVTTIAGRAEQGLIHLPRTKKWTKDLLYELTRFPAGTNDDQVDVLSLLGRGLEFLRPGRRKTNTVKEVKPTNYSIEQLLKRQRLRSQGLLPRKEAPISGHHKPFSDKGWIKEDVL